MLQEVLAGLDTVDAAYTAAGLPLPVVMWKTQSPGGCLLDGHRAYRGTAECVRD